ncbi:MAG TPA: EAL domain-containing protein, partial [Gammaproteobacteria bacterium]|nr:EAL domain-containing protein [Gammaproteobacteria bacterium]
HEVLARMENPEGAGVLPAGDFVPVAQRYGLEHCLDRGVMRAIARDRDAGMLPAGRLFINLSPRNLEAEADLRAILEALELEEEADNRQLVFEVTEREALARQERLAPQLALLKAYGVALALDDFGSGYSNFQNLLRLPISYLKIDGALVRSMDEGPGHRALVESIAGLGRALGMVTLAEFVESEKLLDHLAELGVDLAQGYHLGRPRAPESVVSGRASAPARGG